MGAFFPVRVPQSPQHLVRRGLGTLKKPEHVCSPAVRTSFIGQKPLLGNNDKFVRLVNLSVALWSLNYPAKIFPPIPRVTDFVVLIVQPLIFLVLASVARMYNLSVAALTAPTTLLGHKSGIVLFFCCPPPQIYFGVGLAPQSPGPILLTYMHLSACGWALKWSQVLGHSDTEPTKWTPRENKLVRGISDLRYCCTASFCAAPRGHVPWGGLFRVMPYQPSQQLYCQQLYWEECLLFSSSWFINFLN